MDARTRERRLEAARIIGRFSAKVSEVTPEGFGTWSPGWELVAGPDKIAVSALNAYTEGTGSRQALIDALVDLLAAFRGAALAFDKATRRG